MSTNNILISDNRDAFLIDLGLATREYDLEVLGLTYMFCMKSSEPVIQISKEQWIWYSKDILNLMKSWVNLKQHLEVPPDAEDVIKRLGQIMKRVRYHGG